MAMGKNFLHELTAGASKHEITVRVLKVFAVEIVPKAASKKPFTTMGVLVVDGKGPRRRSAPSDRSPPHPLSLPPRNHATTKL